MTCKDCIHYELCEVQAFNGFNKNWDPEKDWKHCGVFKDKSKYIKLPCKVGDTVYVVPSLCNFRLNIVNGYPENNRICEQKVHSLQMWNANEYCLWTCDGIILLPQRFYKETWFFTKSEAEQKLKELQNEDKGM